MGTKEKNYSDEYATNQYGVKFLMVLFIVVFMVWILNTLHIFIIDQQIMNHATVGATIIFLVGFLCSFIIGYERPFAKYFYILIIYGMVTYMSIFLTYHVTFAIIFPMIHALQYRKRSVTTFSYVLAIVGIILSVILGYNRGLCDANMLLLTYTTTANQIEIFRTQALSFNNDYFTLVLYYAMPRCIIISAAVPLLNHIANSITEKAIRELESKKAAETDSLTGLLNKSAFLAEAETAYTTLGDNSGAFIFVDMDHFKSVNDNLGHSVGDVAITDVAKELKEVFRQKDLIGRFGGDEFVLFITNIPEHLLRERLEELRKRMEKTYTNGEKTVNISASIGAVFFEKQPIYPFSKIMNMADDQAYAVKEAGRNRISITSVKAFAPSKAAQ